jgi:hypothetical protein
MSIIFIIFFLLTIIFTRIFLSFFPISSPKFKFLKVHHYMYGMILMSISFLIINKILFSIGYGLFLDEIPCLILFKKFHYKEYNSKRTIKMLLVLVFLSIEIFYYKNLIVLFSLIF